MIEDATHRGSASSVVQRLRDAACVFAEDEARLLIDAASSPDDLAAMVERRATGTPLEHVLGWAAFCGLEVAVAPGVFVPRRRTELLVRQAASWAREEAHKVPVVVDLCCGSGAVGAALATALGEVELHAVDVDPAAVRCARGNVEPAGGHVYQGDLYSALPQRLRGRVDLLAVNAPYVPSEDLRLMPPEARLFEPRVALDGGADGLDVQRRVVTDARRWLATTGVLLLETSVRQAPLLIESLAATGLAARVVHDEELSATVVIASRLPPSSGVR